MRKINLNRPRLPPPAPDADVPELNSQRARKDFFDFSLKGAITLGGGFIHALFESVAGHGNQINLADLAEHPLTGNPRELAGANKNWGIDPDAVAFLTDLLRDPRSLRSDVHRSATTYIEDAGGLTFFKGHRGTIDLSSSRAPRLFAKYGSYPQLLGLLNESNGQPVVAATLAMAMGYCSDPQAEKFLETMVRWCLEPSSPFPLGASESSVVPILRGALWGRVKRTGLGTRQDALVWKFETLLSKADDAGDGRIAALKPDLQDAIKMLKAHRQV